MELVYLAGIACVQVIALALVTGWVTARTAAQSAALTQAAKEEEWQRQDEVATRVAEAARQAADATQLLLAANRDTIQRTNDVARDAAAGQAKITDQLTSVIEGTKAIHVLVNSDMTAARTAERDSLRLLVLALRRLGTTDATENDEIIRVEQRIVDLNQILADRLAAQQKVNGAAKAS